MIADINSVSKTPVATSRNEESNVGINLPRPVIQIVVDYLVSKPFREYFDAPADFKTHSIYITHTVSVARVTADIEVIRHCFMTLNPQGRMLSNRGIVALVSEGLTVSYPNSGGRIARRPHGFCLATMSPEVGEIRKQCMKEIEDDEAVGINLPRPVIKIVVDYLVSKPLREYFDAPADFKGCPDWIYLAHTVSVARVTADIEVIRHCFMTLNPQGRILSNRAIVALVSEEFRPISVGNFFARRLPNQPPFCLATRSPEVGEIRKQCLREIEHDEAAAPVDAAKAM